MELGPGLELGSGLDLGSVGTEDGAPTTDLEKRMRREIANSNERRRMQSINVGFQSLRNLLPKRDGEKMSKVNPPNSYHPTHPHHLHHTTSYGSASCEVLLGDSLLFASLGFPERCGRGKKLGVGEVAWVVFLSEAGKRMGGAVFAPCSCPHPTSAGIGSSARPTQRHILHMDSGDRWGGALVG